MNMSVIYQPGMTIEQVEKEWILQALRFFRGNKTQTATALGIAIRTLDSKLEKYEDDGKREKQRDDDYRAQQQEILNRMRGIHPAQKVETIPNSHETTAGDGVESTAELSTEQSVPMRERKEVQEMSFRQNTAGRSKRAR